MKITIVVCLAMMATFCTPPFAITNALSVLSEMNFINCVWHAHKNVLAVLVLMNITTAPNLANKESSTLTMVVTRFALMALMETLLHSLASYALKPAVNATER